MLKGKTSRDIKDLYIDLLKEGYKITNIRKDDSTGEYTIRADCEEIYVMVSLDTTYILTPEEI